MISLIKSSLNVTFENWEAFRMLVQNLLQQKFCSEAKKTITLNSHLSIHSTIGEEKLKKIFRLINEGSSKDCMLNAIKFSLKNVIFIWFITPLLLFLLVFYTCMILLCTLLVAIIHKCRPSKSGIFTFSFHKISI